MNKDLKIVRDSNSSLKLLTFQLSNVSELETIKYAYAVPIRSRQDMSLAMAHLLCDLACFILQLIVGNNNNVNF